MTIRPINEFNALGFVSPEALLRLQTLAVRDSTAIVSVFTAVADTRGLTERGRLALARRAEQIAAMMQMAMATPERLSQFQQRLDLLERASYEALLEADERRRIARRELEQLRERAYQITTPDGRSVRVYRDGDVVREESGAVVSPDTIRPEDIGDRFPTWQEMQASQQAAHDAERHYREVTEYRQHLESAQERMRAGNVTAQELDALEAHAQEHMPELVRRRLGEVPAPKGEATREFTPQGQGVLTPGPV